jgi:glutamate dehydrogenase
MSSDLLGIDHFNSDEAIKKNKVWLDSNMPEDFFKTVSTTWQNVIANQLTLLKAHDGVDHLTSKNEGCILTYKSDFDDEDITAFFKGFLIESFHRFSSKSHFANEGALTIIFLKLSSAPLKKDLFEPEEILALSANLNNFNTSFITLCPHSTTQRLFKLIKFLGSKIHHFKCSFIEYSEGFYVSVSCELEKAIDEKKLGALRFYLQYTFSIEAFEEAFDLNLALVIDAFSTLCHQILSQLHSDRFSLKNIEETLLKYSDLTRQITLKYLNSVDPEKKERLDLSLEEKKIISIDSGNPVEDEKRKNILAFFTTLLQKTLKTNFFVKDKKALCFRIDPNFMTSIKALNNKFPENPFGLFFMKGEGFFGFHIRFKDLSRGGLRTVLSRTKEQAENDKPSVFSECYNLSYTQQKKNKDIPEGGSKGIIFCDLHKLYGDEFNHKIKIDADHFTAYRTKLQLSSQKRYILAFLDLINADKAGVLKNKDIVDLYKKPEHIFLGPDENMTDPMIEWIASTSLKKDYFAKTAFISSKPKAGINHKTYGVTSFGVNTYMEEVLKFLNIDPFKEAFTVKISGGPDGDVAGNQMMNLKKYYPKTAKLIAITDVSGTIYDPAGLDLDQIEVLFHEGKPLRFYPHHALKPGAFLLDLQTKKEESDTRSLTLLVKNDAGTIKQDYIEGQEASKLFRQNMHQVKADVFIPAGGRPRTLNEFNVQEYLDKEGKPSSKAIVEGANLYLTKEARRFLEERGVLIMKDSSANKGGVICSSYEVLGGLCLSDEQFMAIKDKLVEDILHLIKDKAGKEARLLLKSFKEKLGYLTDLSDVASEKINTYKYELLASLEDKELSNEPSDPLNKIVISYIPNSIKKGISDRHILESISSIHKKAIIACHLGASIVYHKGLTWNPGICELLPLLLEEPLA